MLQKACEEVAECLRRAADAEACTDDTNDPKGKAEYQRIAESWRVRLGHFCGEVEASNTPRYAALSLYAVTNFRP